MDEIGKTLKGLHIFRIVWFVWINPMLGFNAFASMVPNINE